MTAGFLFPYKPIPYRPTAPIGGYQVPSRYDPPSRGGGTPATYDSRRHTVDCIIATGSPLRCRFGLEAMRISDRAVDLSLLDEGRLPLLDSHDSRRVLGRVVDCWIENRQLRGTLRFNKTPAGLYAEALVARGELTGVSCHATATRWTDEDGDPVSNNKLNNPHFTTWGDGNLKGFTARRWMLNEVSLTSCPRAIPRR